MKIAVLMSTYNGEKYIKEQVNSILKQTGKYLNNHNAIVRYFEYTKGTSSTILRETLVRVLGE